MQLSAELPGRGVATLRGVTFCLCKKSPKTHLGVSPLRTPDFRNRVVEGFISQTVSVERLPTNLGGFVTAPVGLLCSGYQNRKVVVSLIPLLFMAWRRLAGRDWRSHGAPAGAQRSGAGGERTPARRRAFRSATAAKRRLLARR